MSLELGFQAHTHQLDEGVVNVSVFDKARHLVCGLQGHDHLLQFGRDRLFLKCVTCGHESPGWEISDSRPPVTQSGDRLRHLLQRPHLVEARRIA
jgi:hypothetical protein